MEKIKSKFNLLKQKPVLFYGIGCLLLFILSIFAAYYIRVIYSPSWFGQIRGTAGIFAFLWLCYTVFCLFARFKEKNIQLFMAGLILVLGTVFTFATPPNQVPDEQTHFLRAYAMAQVQFAFDAQHVYPDDVNSFILHFPVAHNNGYPAKEGNTVYNRFTEYYAALASGEKAPNTQIIIFQTVPYLPQAAGIFLARLAGVGALGAFYAGRLGNVIFFALCSYFALKSAGRFKILLFTLMALPLMSFVTASNSSDAMLFGLMFLMFGAVLSEKFTAKNLAVFAVSMAILCTSKMSYIVFFPLLFAVRKENWQVKIGNRELKKWQALMLSLAVFGAFYVFMSLYVKYFSNYGVIDRTMTDSNPSAQLAFILSNPFRYMAVFADTLKNNAFFLFSGGTLGWLDVKLPIISYMTPIIVIFAAAKQSDVFKKEDRGMTAMMFVCALLTYGVVLTGMYLSWAPVTLPQIIGLQMRYVYPAFMGFAMVIGQYFSARTKPQCKKTDFSCIATSYVFSLLAVVLMLIVYYLPERAVVFVA